MRKLKKELLTQDKVSARVLAQFLDKLSAALLVHPASLHKMEGGDNIWPTDCSDKGNLGLVSRAIFRNQGQPLPGKQNITADIQASEGLNGLDVESGLLCSVRQVVGPGGHYRQTSLLHGSQHSSSIFSAGELTQKWQKQMQSHKLRQGRWTSFTHLGVWFQG